MREIHSIIRIEKVKTYGQLAAKNNHNHRLIDVPNADANTDIKCLIGSSDIVDDVKQHLVSKGINPHKIRKNGVICNEIVATLSPDFFIDNKLDLRGKFNKKNTVEFVNIVKKFLIDTYGDNLVNLVIHLDETTPHLHAIIVPVYEDVASGSFKLAAKRFFDRPQLQLLQKRYCAAFRYLKGYQVTYQEKSSAKHKDIKTFYSEINHTKLDFESELIEKEKIISRLRDERTRLRREVTHYQVVLSKVKKYAKKVEEALAYFPEQFTQNIVQMITKIICVGDVKYDDRVIELKVDHSDNVQPEDKRIEDKPQRKLQPLSPLRKPKPRP
ncbi:plasmid recombination protein [Thalassotalea euphylliae]|uniref:Mobilization protein n=1 Tax=Thalassotalea euphylliae TaxID=1655234 RepID=A0A3E0UBV5_9GAMM|nr:plasmid recombination protein [Thalassotalea euphylliae]REL34047.1 hypothetical protein DXX92_01035 [Thalassotalea euphylliae]